MTKSIVRALVLTMCLSSMPALQLHATDNTATTVGLVGGLTIIGASFMGMYVYTKKNRKPFWDKSHRLPVFCFSLSVITGVGIALASGINHESS